MSQENAKRSAGIKAAGLIETGMKVGLGTGSTANFFIDALAYRALDIVCVATSKASEQRARGLGFKLSTLDETSHLDITVDGADEIGPGLSLIKGGGGALLYEKIVAAASAQMVVIADSSKCVDALGQFPLPIEVMPFGLGATQRAVNALCADLGLQGALTLRGGATPFITDGGHYILDASLGRIDDPTVLADGLAHIAGVVEHGLFLGLAARAFIADGHDVKEIFA